MTPLEAVEFLSKHASHWAYAHTIFKVLAMANGQSDLGEGFWAADTPARVILTRNFTRDTAE